MRRKLFNTTNTVKSKTMKYTHGFQPTLSRRIIRRFAKIFVDVFGLNRNSEFSTEVCQLIRPISTVAFENQELKFLSGHGRLKWRADSFFSEEPLMIDWIRSFDNMDVFLDVGANVGTYTIPAAYRCGKVFAVELDPANIFCLHNNILLNNLQDNCVILPFAAGSRLSVESVFYRDISLGDALQSIGREQILGTIKPNPHVVNQITFPLDYIFEEFKLPQPSKIKVDVDGNEELVCLGAENLIKNADELYYEDNNLKFDVSFKERMLAWGYSVSHEHVTRSTARNLIFTKKHPSNRAYAKS